LVRPRLRRIRRLLEEGDEGSKHNCLYLAGAKKREIFDKGELPFATNEALESDRFPITQLNEKEREGGAKGGKGPENSKFLPSLPVMIEKKKRIWQNVFWRGQRVSTAPQSQNSGEE